MRIVIADDHPLYLEAARLEVQKIFAEAEIVAAFSVSTTVECLAAPSSVDLVIADFSMPGMDGAMGIARLIDAARGAPVVVMSGVAEPADVQACIVAGVRGFLPKTMVPDTFASALRIIIAGGSYVPVEFATGGPPAASVQQRRANFTDREFDILRMVVEGRSNKEIARNLNCQEVTIKVNLTRIFGKLGARNRTQAAMLAVESNLVAKNPG